MPCWQCLLLFQESLQEELSWALYISVEDLYEKDCILSITITKY